VERRKRKLVRLDLQLKVVFVTLFVASLVLLINFQLSLAALWSLSGKLTATMSVAAALEELRRSLIGKFLTSVGIAVPLAAAVGILYSFRFCGPIYRFKKYFKEIASGRWDSQCSLRKGDDLQDVCDSIVVAMTLLQDFLKENRGILKEIEEIQNQGLIVARGEDLEKVKGLLERVAVANAVFQQRFPPPPEPPSSAPDAEAAEEVKELELQP
jgi:uncharacterized transporter YbjL